MRACLSILLLLVCHTASATPPPEIRAMAERLVPKVRVENDAAFFAAWNLDYAGMDKVKEAVQAGDLAAAKVALKDYFIQRRSPRWRMNHWQMPTKPRGKPEQHSKYKEGERVEEVWSVMDR